MKTSIEAILANKSISCVFQPIVDSQRREIVGYEALTRGPAGHPLQSPELLFQVATEHGLLSELEILCRDNAIRRFAELALPGKLFLNISPMILLSQDHPQGETVRMVEQAGLSCDRIVIELTEKYQVQDAALLQQAITRYRQCGFEVAIDDLGAGYSGLKLWSELRPDIVKIDRYFIHECHRDIIKREFLHTIFELGRSTNAQIIAEGIETEEEYQLLSELGMQYAQGYLVARPSATPPRSLTLPRCEAPPEALPSSETLQQLVMSSMTVDIGADAGSVYQLLTEHPEVTNLPVLSKGVPVGMVYREHLMERFSARYGHALLAKKPIAKLMDKQPLVFDWRTGLDQVSLAITERADVELGRDFIVSKEGSFLGLASTKSLLRRITESKIENARYANPLTLLPGNVPLYRELDYLLASNKDFRLAYLDLNHFKPFNDIYGYAKGDMVLELVAEIIREVCREQDCFIGHVGGDDFVILFRAGGSQSLCAEILDCFDERIRAYFSPEHLAMGGYRAMSRSGQSEFFSLLSLSIGLVHPDPRLCPSHHAVAALASDAKKQAKKLTGSGLFVCRRRGAAYPSNMANQGAA